MDQRVAPLPGLARVSTSDVPASQRGAYWVDLVCRHLIAIECEPAHAGSGFHGAIERRSVGSVDLSLLASCAQQVQRTASLLAQADGEFILLNLQRSGYGVLRQDGREVLLAPGDIALYSSTRAYQLAFDGAFEQTVMVLPAASLRALCPAIDRMTAVRLAARQPLVDLLAATAMTYFHTPFDGLAAGCVQHAELALTQTVAACVIAHAGQEVAPHSHLTLYHLNRIRQYALAHLADSGLSVQQVGAALSLSASHIHRVFEAQHQTFGSWLWECRLQACARALRQRELARLPISQVAYRCGFSNAAHFSRAFRARFGVTAREWRNLPAAPVVAELPLAEGREPAQSQWAAP